MPGFKLNNISTGSITLKSIQTFAYTFQQNNHLVNTEQYMIQTTHKYTDSLILNMSV